MSRTPLNVRHDLKRDMLAIGQVSQLKPLLYSHMTRKSDPIAKKSQTKLDRFLFIITLLRFKVDTVHCI